MRKELIDVIGVWFGEDPEGFKGTDLWETVHNNDSEYRIGQVAQDFLATEGLALDGDPADAWGIGALVEKLAKNMDDEELFTLGRAIKEAFTS
jgi:hypothetical protein